MECSVDIPNDNPGKSRLTQHRTIVWIAESGRRMCSRAKEAQYRPAAADALQQKKRMSGTRRTTRMIRTAPGAHLVPNTCTEPAHQEPPM